MNDTKINSKFEEPQVLIYGASNVELLKKYIPLDNVKCDGDILV